MSLSEIAKLEKVSETTVYRDMLAIRKSWAKQAKLARSVERAIEDMLALSNEIQREAWQLLHGTKMDLVKVSCLRTLQQERSEIIAVLQNLGALPKEADKLDITDWRQRLREIAAGRQQRAEAPNKTRRAELNRW